MEHASSLLNRSEVLPNDSLEGVEGLLEEGFRSVRLKRFNDILNRSKGIRCNVLDSFPNFFEEGFDSTCFEVIGRRLDVAGMRGGLLGGGRDSAKRRWTIG